MPLRVFFMVRGLKGARRWRIKTTKNSPLSRAASLALRSYIPATPPSRRREALYSRSVALLYAATLSTSLALLPTLSFLFIRNYPPSHAPCLSPCLRSWPQPLKKWPPNPPRRFGACTRAHVCRRGHRCGCVGAGAPLQGLMCAWACDL